MEKTTSNTLVLTPGMKLDVDGGLYQVERKAGKFYIMKWAGSSDPDNPPARRLKKNDEFTIHIGLRKHKFRAVSVVGRSKFRIGLLRD